MNTGHSRRARLAIVFAGPLAFLMAHGSARAQLCTQHTFLGNGPDEGQPGWHDEANGLTHDEDHWYIAQNFDSSFGTVPLLWRIPVTHDLSDHVDCSTAGVTCRSADADTPLFGLGYNHYGDPDFYRFEGDGYLVVPAEGGSAGRIAAVFRGDETLAFLAFAPLPQEFLSWLAVDPMTGILVSSQGRTVDQLTRYAVRWEGLRENPPVLPLAEAPPILLRDESGAPLEINSIQGGEFSDDGQLLYLSAGFLAGRCADPTCVFDCPNSDPSWGVHVFRTRPGTAAECGPGGDGCVIARRIERSTKSSGGFSFQFDPTAPSCEETEGLTFWDLDADGRAPGLGGQLHVVLLDNEATTEDDVFVKHYRVSLDDPVPPEIMCPGDVTAQCSFSSGVPATDPQLSSFFGGVSVGDNCDDELTLSHDAPGLFGLGTTSVTFAAADDFGNVSQCAAGVTVVDTNPPDLQCPAAVTVECTGGGGIRSDDPQLASFLEGAVAIDVCDSTPQVSNDTPLFLPLGPTVVTFTAADDSMNATDCRSTVTVADTVAPNITVSVAPRLLWPPGHQLVAIAADVRVTDRCDPAASFRLVSITSNEPDNGLGDGDAPGDIQGAALGTPDVAFRLRAERSGLGTGRIYTIVYRASDAAGNARDASALVTVPLSR